MYGIPIEVIKIGMNEDNYARILTASTIFLTQRFSQGQYATVVVFRKSHRALCFNEHAWKLLEKLVDYRILGFTYTNFTIRICAKPIYDAWLHQHT